MSRNALQVRESRWHDRWARFVRGVKRIVTVVSLICIAVLVGLLTQRATDMPVQHIAIAARKTLAAVQRPVAAFSHSIGIGMGYEAALEERLDEIAQRVVDHPVAEGRGRDQPAFGFVDIKTGIGTGMIRKGFKFNLELK